MGNELTEGPVTKSMLRFAVPIILGDLLQQCYNIADTVNVGRFLGADALAAVGSSFSLMTFLTSILLGLAMGSGTVFSIRFGQKDRKALKECVLASFVLLFAVTVFLTAVIFAGMFGIFLYNFFAALLRSLGNSVVPLIFLAVSAGLNIGLDLWFVAGLEWGVAGAAVVAQGVRYLRIEGSFYCLIGILFLLYGLYRALGKPGMSVVLTVVSLGVRVALAYGLAAIPSVGVTGIWCSVPIGWFLADALGTGYYLFWKKKRH